MAVLFTSPFVVVTVVLTLAMGEVVDVDGRIDVLFETTTGQDLHRLLSAVAAIANVLAGLVAWGAMAAYLWRRRVLQPIDWRRAVKLAAERLNPLLIVAMLEFLIVVVMAILFITVFNVGVVSLAIVVLTGAAIFIRVWPAQVVVIVEDEPAVDALRRTWDLASGQGWNVARTLVLTALRMIGYAFVIALVILFFSLTIDRVAGPTAALIWSAVSQLILLSLLSPLLVAVAVPLYVDLRRRQEADRSE
jgi:hypothetical protein